MERMTIHAALLIAGLAAAVSCSSGVPENGVARGLAAERSATISELSYNLRFDLCCEPGHVESEETVAFSTARKQDIVLDFKAPEGSLLEVKANGRGADIAVAGEHIVIPRRLIRKGTNEIRLRFTAGEYSLNRRDDFLYTLLVPDRARTLFPCFDQPDLKARYNLTLALPEGWTAVSNTAISEIRENVVSFAATEPLSTYLFSFVAGKFERLEASRGGRTVAMYHRETDAGRIAQSGDIFKLVFDSLEWLEQYTGIPYPFAKYDFVAIPDFQYGGMEHTGATLYNAGRLFTGDSPTTGELLNRASLIAHETAHMWFGDYVTMRWFDDVWTKEVFANWFAAKMVRPMFPGINHELSDLMTLYASAYEEDRTEGRVPIHQDLDNLSDAGLIYSNTIYDKAPIVMEMLSEKLGPERFQSCIREYLKRFAYANASWDDLVGIFDASTDEDIRTWSQTWIETAGMPEHTGPGDGDVLEEGRYWIPNRDGHGYGWYRPDTASMDYIMANWSGYGETERMSLLMTLYENSWHGELERGSFVGWCSSMLPQEKNPLIFSSLISYASKENARLDDENPSFAETLLSIAASPGQGSERRLLAFRSLCTAASSESQWKELYRIWREREPYPGLTLSEKDYTNLAYRLMTAYPDSAEEIAAIQRSRITNPDRLGTFDFVCRAATPDSSARRALFESFLASPDNRRPESRVLQALALLCRKELREEAENYIIPSLAMLPEIQATGDIFFPSRWCGTLLECQLDNDSARRKVHDFLAGNPDINPLLVKKILQSL